MTDEFDDSGDFDEFDITEHFDNSEDSDYFDEFDDSDDFDFNVLQKCQTMYQKNENAILDFFTEKS